MATSIKIFRESRDHAAKINHLAKQLEREEIDKETAKTEAIKASKEFIVALEE